MYHYRKIKNKNGSEFWVIEKNGEIILDNLCMEESAKMITDAFNRCGDCPQRNDRSCMKRNGYPVTAVVICLDWERYGYKK